MASCAVSLPITLSACLSDARFVGLAVKSETPSNYAATQSLSRCYWRNLIKNARIYECNVRAAYRCLRLPTLRSGTAISQLDNREDSA